ncbi:S-type pyocin domain-containing protein [Pseudomonas gingeri]|nr:S-type pyocin domain-containing protein [Pseudomonas gingeri]
MADERYVVGQAFEIRPLHIVAGRPQTFGSGVGGAYSGNGDGWGLQEGPRRGEGGPGRFRDTTTPNVLSDLMGGETDFQFIADEYEPRLKALLVNMEQELAQKKQAATGESVLSPEEAARLDQRVTLDLIDVKKSQYISTAPAIYGLYGHNPFFMMEVLPRQKMRELWLSGAATAESVSGLHALFDTVYRAALELKVLSLSMDVLAAKLAELDTKRRQAESAVSVNDAAWQALLEQRLGVIGVERDIHVQRLPEFLQTELSIAAGSVAGLAPAQALIHYKTVLDDMIAGKLAAIRPIQAPPPWTSGGVTLTYPATNPKIVSPLSKPELEALANLVHLQATGQLGQKWASHHDALLKSESARYLGIASNAFGALAARARAVADEQARLFAKTEAKRKAAEAHTFRLAPTGATQLSAAAGFIAITTGTGLTLEAAIQSGIQALKTLGSAVLDRATGVGIGLLLYSPSLGNSDLYPPTTLSLPARDLIPDLPENLSAIAVAGGTVDLPYRVYGDRSKYSLIATQANGGLSPKVPVRALTLDPAANAYTFTTADTPAITLTFPIAAPDGSSTTSPVQPVEIPIYTGITLTPIEVKAEPLPGMDQWDIRDGIYTFPADSGLPPIYVVFSSPYEGATTRGEHSGRMYNPDKAGGAIQNLDWTTASVTQDGIDLVKLHTGRFAPSDANAIMVDRLEKVLRGELSIADVDKRFYTHEIRELERYRALGIADGVVPKGKDAASEVWNNAHTATLEDYKLKDEENLFYTFDAIKAADEQVWREFK